MPDGSSAQAHQLELHFAHDGEAIVVELDDDLDRVDVLIGALQAPDARDAERRLEAGLRDHAVIRRLRPRP